MPSDTGTRKRRKKAVEVVVAPSSFPAPSSVDLDKPSSNTRSGSVSNNTNITTETKRKGIDIDFNETAREIHQLGSTQFIGKQKRQYEHEQYRALTGRDRKKQKVPVKIVRGLKKAAAKREERQKQELKESGVVTAKNTENTSSGKKYNKQNRKDIDNHGPAPNIGFTKRGVYHVSNAPK